MMREFKILSVFVTCISASCVHEFDRIDGLAKDTVKATIVRRSDESTLAHRVKIDTDSDEYVAEVLLKLAKQIIRFGTQRRVHAYGMGVEDLKWTLEIECPMPRICVTSEHPVGYFVDLPLDSGSHVYVHHFANCSKDYIRIIAAKKAEYMAFMPEAIKTILEFALENREVIDRYKDALETITKDRKALEQDMCPKLQKVEPGVEFLRGPFNDCCEMKDEDDDSWVVWLFCLRVSQLGDIYHPSFEKEQADTSDRGREICDSTRNCFVSGLFCDPTEHRDLINKFVKGNHILKRFYADPRIKSKYDRFWAARREWTDQCIELEKKEGFKLTLVNPKNSITIAGFLYLLGFGDWSACLNYKNTMDKFDEMIALFAKSKSDNAESLKRMENNKPKSSASGFVPYSSSEEYDKLAAINRGLDKAIKRLQEIKTAQIKLAQTRVIPLCTIA